MTSAIGSIDIYLDPATPPNVDLNDNEGGEPFAVIDLTPWPGRTYIAVRSRAEADALVKAALAARDLLPEPEPWVCPSCDTRFVGEQPADGLCGMCQPKLPVYQEPPGVEHCKPGDCTCDSHAAVTA